MKNKTYYVLVLQLLLDENKPIGRRSFPHQNNRFMGLGIYYLIWIGATKYLQCCRVMDEKIKKLFRYYLNGDPCKTNTGTYFLN